MTEKDKRARCFHLALVLCVLAIGASSQTIRPVRTEYRTVANGTFELVNDTFTPVNVVLEPQSFTVSETGEISYRSLDSGIHVKFSASSFRIQPKQTYIVSYRATADKLPAWFVVYANHSNLPIRTATGMNVVLKLPHTVYILPKKDAAKAEIKIVKSDFDASAKKIRFELRSESANFVRVLGVRVENGKSKIDDGGFPLFPGASRMVELDWKDPSPPAKASFQFENYRIQSAVTQR